MTKNHPDWPKSFYYQSVPDYMTEVYDWAYVNPRWARCLDRNSVVKTLLFANDQRLMRALLDQIQPGMRVWQVAHVYGDLVAKIAARVGESGQFDLSDVTPVQIEQARDKLRCYPQAAVIQADAAVFDGGGRYDLVSSFFLLHEVPDEKKRAIVNNVLQQLAANGRAVFVDYHRPACWQPIGYLLRLVNRWLEPFAFALWQQDIQCFAADAHHYHWHKRTLFGGVYQVVRATRKS